MVEGATEEGETMRRREAPVDEEEGPGTHSLYL